jgi:hypothetical protein
VLISARRGRDHERGSATYDFTIEELDLSTGPIETFVCSIHGGMEGAVTGS